MRVLNTDRQDLQGQVPTPTPMGDLADKVKGMYRLLDLIGESGSNGYGYRFLFQN
jgi:hypothetical protein